MGGRSNGALAHLSLARAPLGSLAVPLESPGDGSLLGRAALALRAMRGDQVTDHFRTISPDDAEKLLVWYQALEETALTLERRIERLESWVAETALWSATVVTRIEKETE